MAPRKGKKTVPEPEQEPIKKAGRPELISPELIEKICSYVKYGNTYEISARACGITETTLRNWRRRGESESADGIVPADSLYVKLIAELSKAEAEGEAQMVGLIAGQGPEGMKWILQRRHPERWQDSQKLRIEMDRRADELLEMFREGLTDAEYAKVIAVLEAGGATGD